MKKQAQYYAIKIYKRQTNRENGSGAIVKQPKYQPFWGNIFLDLSKLKGVEDNRDLFPSQCRLHYSNREISPQVELVFWLKII